MKLVSFDVKTPLGPMSRIGALIDGEVETSARFVDLNLAYATLLRESGEPKAYELAGVALPPSMLGYLEGGANAQERARQTLDFIKSKPGALGPRGETLVYSRNEVRLQAPVLRPVTVRDFSTYEEHSGGDESRPGWYFFPGAYRSNPGSFYGPEDDAIMPAYTEWLDPELELGVYINKKGRNIKIEDAESYIGGYSIYIDLSARDTGMKDFLGPYKGKDFCSITGPCLVTPDEFDEHKGKAGIRVNGETWYETDLGHLRHHYSRELIAYASDGETLLPGELIGSGTIGLAASITLGKWLHPGDILEQYIEGIGTLSVKVVREENPDSYVRHGLPGQLSLPPWAEGAVDRIKEQIANSAAARMVPRGARYKRD